MKRINLTRTYHNLGNRVFPLPPPPQAVLYLLHGLPYCKDVFCNAFILYGHHSNPNLIFSPNYALTYGVVGFPPPLGILKDLRNFHRGVLQFLEVSHNIDARSYVDMVISPTRSFINMIQWRIVHRSNFSMHNLFNILSLN